MADKTNNKPAENNSAVEKRRKAVESTAAFGLILLAVGLVAPFTNLTDAHFISIFKWIYAPGALIFTIARMVGATDPGDSMRVRRLRRLEFWAGIAFCIGAFFWFWNERHFSAYLNENFGTLRCLNETVIFSLVGALIQVMALWMISYRVKKDRKAAQSDDTADK